MDQDPHHLRYKAEMTAALYVAQGLDPTAEEGFELHLMECPQCVDDVEAWRSIQKHMPLATAAAPAAAASASAAMAPVAAVATRSAAAQASFGHWRLAASLVGIALLGAAGGWYGRARSAPGLENIAFFNAAPLERGATECMALKFGTATQRIALRFAGLAAERNVVALSSPGEELAARDYSARRQADGSWLVEFAPRALGGGALAFEARAAGHSAEPLGCVSAPAAR